MLAGALHALAYPECHSAVLSFTLDNSFGSGLVSEKLVQNTERANNLLVGALKQFPMEYIFNVVYRLKEVGISSQHAAAHLLHGPDCRCVKWLLPRYS